MREVLNRWLGGIRSKLFRGPYLLCSECFQDAGIRREAAAQGQRFDGRACPNCHAKKGMLLDKEGVEALQLQFFSWSTATHRYQIPVPVLGIGGGGDDQVQALRPETSSDWNLIKKITGNNLFYRSPRLFYLGITNHYGEYGCLRKQGILDEVLPKLRYRRIGRADEMYRIRSNLTEQQQFNEGQFDSPPVRRRGFGRFDHGKLPVLYASPSLTVCIHECRVTLADDVFVATLEPKRDLNLIDLSGNYDEPDNADPFDSVEWFLNGLMSSSRPNVHRYCRRIANTLLEATACDGLVYSSYFRNVAAADTLPRINYALFGRPIAEGKVGVKSINTVRLESIAYDFRLGPVFE